MEDKKNSYQIRQTKYCLVLSMLKLLEGTTECLRDRNNREIWVRSRLKIQCGCSSLQLSSSRCSLRQSHSKRFLSSNTPYRRELLIILRSAYSLQKFAPLLRSFCLYFTAFHRLYISRFLLNLDKLFVIKHRYAKEAILPSLNCYFNQFFFSRRSLNNFKSNMKIP